MLIQQDIQCNVENCDNREFANIQINNPTISNGKIAYKMLIKDGISGTYTIGATVNVGWCGNQTVWIRDGDYNNEYSFRVKLSDDNAPVNRDVDVILYNKNGKHFH